MKFERLPVPPTGTKFGRWTVLSAGPIVRTVGTCLCRCDCGTERLVRLSRMRDGTSLSCGCLTRERRNAAKTIHGCCYIAEYTTWAQMKARCTNPKHKQFDNYGGRGISVCERWAESFENFMADMGPRPPGDYSLDRIDNNGNYEPGNCRWATRVQQGRNRRSNRMIEIDGQCRSAIEWSEISGVSVTCIYGRLNVGADPRTAVFTPLHEFSKHGHDLMHPDKQREMR